MKYRPPAPLSANRPADFRPSYANLRQAFMSLPDPRRQTKNKQYPLWSLLMATLAAFLSGQTNLLAVSEWLDDQQPYVKRALGFCDGTTPHQTTFARLFAKLRHTPLEIALTSFFAPVRSQHLPARGSLPTALDGKCLRSWLKFTPEEGIPVHLLSLFCQTTGLVLAQTYIPRDKNEYSTALSFVESLNWQGRVLTGDAAFCYEKLCRKVVELGGDYFICLKANQPTLLSEAELTFDTSLLPAGLPFDLRYYKELDKGHGRLEIRHLGASCELSTLTKWPYLAQVVQIRREWYCKKQGGWRDYTVYAITSLPAQVADVADLLALKRGHWNIENQLHWVRDVVFGEDECLARKGEGPLLLSALRNTVLNLLRNSGQTKICASLRSNASKPDQVLALLGLTPSA